MGTSAAPSTVLLAGTSASSTLRPAPMTGACVMAASGRMRVPKKRSHGQLDQYRSSTRSPKILTKRATSPAVPFGISEISLGRGVDVARDRGSGLRAVRMIATRSLDRLRIDRRPRAAGDDQRRAAEEELVDAVLLAV